MILSELNVVHTSVRGIQEGLLRFTCIFFLIFDKQNVYYQEFQCVHYGKVLDLRLSLFFHSQRLFDLIFEIKVVLSFTENYLCPPHKSD